MGQREDKNAHIEHYLLHINLGFITYTKNMGIGENY